MSNFEFLKNKIEYEKFSTACLEAEESFASSPLSMSATSVRKALDLATTWVYDKDHNVTKPDNSDSYPTLSSLIHEPTFRKIVDDKTWGELCFIIRLGNQSTHTAINIKKEDAIRSLKALFMFIVWIDRRYGSNYKDRIFDENKIPKTKKTFFQGALTGILGTLGTLSVFSMWLFSEKQSKQK